MKATLYNPETKQRQAVGGEGQPTAQDLYGQGYKLETSYNQETGVSTFDEPITEQKQDSTSVHGVTAVYDPIRGWLNKDTVAAMTAGESFEQENNIVLAKPTEPAGEPDAQVTGAKEATKGIEKYIQELTPAPTETEQKETGFLEEITSLVEQYGEKGADILKAEKEAGLSGLQSQYADINAQMLTKSAEYDQLMTSIEGKPITMSSIIGQQAQVRRAKASEIGLLQARAQGLQGQISTAQATVDRAIDLKYSVIENNINVYEAQLRAIQPKLNKEQAIQAQAQQIMIQDYRERQAEKKEEDKNIQNIALITQQNGADGALTDLISNATTQLEAMEIAGELAYSGGWEYVATPARRDELLKQGYEMVQSGGRTYVRKGAETNPEVQAYVQQIQNGHIKLSSVPTAIRGEVAQQLGDVAPQSTARTSTTRGRARKEDVGLEDEELDEEDMSEFDYGRSIIEANPEATTEELKAGLLEQINLGNLDLSVSEVNALIGARKEPEEPELELFSEDWFKSKIDIARKNEFSDDEIADYMLENFDTNELFKTAKEAGYAKWYTGKEKDIKRYIKSLL